MLKNYDYDNNERKATAIRNVCINRDYKIRHLKRKRQIKEHQFNQWDASSTNPRKTKLQREVEAIDLGAERIIAKAKKEIQEIQAGQSRAKCNNSESKRCNSTSSGSSWFEYYDSCYSGIDSL